MLKKVMRVVRGAPNVDRRVWQVQQAIDRLAQEGNAHFDEVTYYDGLLEKVRKLIERVSASRQHHLSEAMRAHDMANQFRGKNKE